MRHVPAQLIRGLLVVASLAVSTAGLTASLHSHPRYETGCTAHDANATHGEHDGDSPSRDAGDCPTCYQLAQVSQNVVPQAVAAIEPVAETARACEATDQAARPTLPLTSSSPRAPPLA